MRNIHNEIRNMTVSILINRSRLYYYVCHLFFWHLPKQILSILKPLSSLICHWKLSNSKYKSLYLIWIVYWLLMVYESHLTKRFKSHSCPFSSVGTWVSLESTSVIIRGGETLQMIPSIPTSIVLNLSRAGVSEIIRPPGNCPLLFSESNHAF